MTKIVVTNHQEFTPEQKQKLDSLGDVKYYETLPKDGEEYLQRVKGADIICSGTAGLTDAYAKLKNVYVTVAYVSVAFVDIDVLRKNNVTLSNAPGSNRHAVSEWVMYMVLQLMRDFSDFVNSTENIRKNGGMPHLTRGLAGNKMTILGKGHIGTRVGELAKAFEMNVNYFSRADDLYTSVKDADVVVDVLSSNPTTKGLLDGKFFDAMKQGSYFVSVTRSEILDENAMLAALDNSKLKGAALDCSGILVGDTDDPNYKKLLAHPKVYVTPHTAYNTFMSTQTGAKIMVENVEAYIKGKPQNVVT